MKDFAITLSKVCTCFTFTLIHVGYRKVEVEETKPEIKGKGSIYVNVSVEVDKKHMTLNDFQNIESYKTLKKKSDLNTICLSFWYMW